VAKRFLAYLSKRNVAVEVAKPADVESYLRKELRRFRRLRQRRPTALGSWHHKRTAPIHLLLRTVQRDWPPIVPPTTPLELFHQQLLDGCARWLADCRGLAAQTIVARRGQWQQFLNWLEERGSQERLRDLSVADLDAYLQFRAQSVRRSTRAELALGLRSFVAYLYHRGFLARDLSQTITGPTMYAFEGIPSALTREQIAIVVEFARKDRTPSGLRTFAIVMLLAEYGLRAGEVVCLRLEDIDWRQECLRIRHSKTGAETTLPLIPSVGCPAGLLAAGPSKNGGPRGLCSAPGPSRAAAQGLQPLPPDSTIAGQGRNHSGRETGAAHVPSCTCCKPVARRGAPESDRRHSGPPVCGFDPALSQTGDRGPTRRCA